MNAYFEEFPENVKIVINSAELFDKALGIDESFGFLARDKLSKNK